MFPRRTRITPSSQRLVCDTPTMDSLSELDHLTGNVHRWHSWLVNVGPVASEHGRNWRNSSFWTVAPAVTLLLFLPVMRRVARLDSYHYSLPNHDGIRVRTHSGLFLAYGLAVAAPSLIAGILARRLVRWVSVVVAVTALTLAGLCELFVSIATW
jgi:hypothetical protein